MRNVLLPPGLSVRIIWCQTATILRCATESFIQLRVIFPIELRRTASSTSCLCLQNKHLHRLAVALPILLSASFILPPNFSISTLEFLKFACFFVYLVQHISVPSQIISINCVLLYINNPHPTYYKRPRWPRGLRRGSAAVRLLGLRVRIPPGA
jgi:hypothetical protein